VKFSLEGKVAVVTGAGSGIGRGIAIAFAQHGADIVAAGLDPAQLEETCRMVGAEGCKAVAVAADFLDPARAAVPVERALEAFGKVDILVNAAGGASTYVEGGMSEMLDATLASVEQLFRLNAFAPFVAAQAAARAMRDRGEGGVIINVTSSSGYAPDPSVQAYGGAKAALHIMGTAWAKELAPLRIRVNEIIPGAVDTANIRNSLAKPGGREALTAPLGRLGVPEDLAAAALYLASDEAEWVSGAAIRVSGGRVF
jgi:NAD(P)-dependent dehydrogenase (short-subunit alcohol dehydrogenase family)